jgi:hypothetical protein
MMFKKSERVLGVGVVERIVITLRIDVGVINRVYEFEKPVNFVCGPGAEFPEPLERPLALGCLPRQRFFLGFYVVCRRVCGWRAMHAVSLGHLI